MWINVLLKLARGLWVVQVGKCMNASWWWQTVRRNIAGEISKFAFWRYSGAGNVNLLSHFPLKFADLIHLPLPYRAVYYKSHPTICLQPGVFFHRGVKRWGGCFSCGNTVAHPLAVANLARDSPAEVTCADAKDEFCFAAVIGTWSILHASIFGTPLIPKAREAEPG